jgi:hypothetical protein
LRIKGFDHLVELNNEDEMKESEGLLEEKDSYEGKKILKVN